MRNDILAAADIAVVFIDIQEGIIGVGSTIEPARLRTAVAALGDLATIFALPILISSVPTTGGTVAPPIAEVSARFPTAQPLVRTTAGAMDDEPFRTALAQTRRTTVVIAGVATEIAVRQAALAMQRAGLHVVIAVDACNGLDARTEAATFSHLSACAVELSTVATIAAQLAGDFTSERGRAAMRALQSTLVTHGHDHGGDESG